MQFDNLLMLIVLVFYVIDLFGLLRFVVLHDDGDLLLVWHFVNAPCFSLVLCCFVVALHGDDDGDDYNVLWQFVNAPSFGVVLSVLFFLVCCVLLSYCMVAMI